MFLFKSKKKNTSEQVNIDSYTDIAGEFEDLKKSPKQIIVNMNCCDSKFSISKLFNRSLCPNCNTQLNFIIEKNTTTDSDETHDETQANTQANTHDETHDDIQANMQDEIRAKTPDKIPKQYLDIEIFSIIIIAGIISYFIYIPMCTQSYP